MTTRQKYDYVERELRAKDWFSFPALALGWSGTPLCVLTNCCMYPFDEAKYTRTPTKTYYRFTGEQHLMNVTAAAAIKLMDRGLRVVMHVPIEIEDRMRRLIALHPDAHLSTIVTGDLYTRDCVGKLYDHLAFLAREATISRVDFCLYDSYASGLSRPFLPMFEDDPAVAARLAHERTHFLYYFSMMAYDLLVRSGQGELRFICPTALAAKRPSSHLFTDTIHKAVSNVLLRTLAYELPYYCEKPARIVEIAPGIVDSGLYDDVLIRQATYQESVMDGFALDHDESRLETFPMMSIDVLAEACLVYLTAKIDEELAEMVGDELRLHTYAGRSAEEFTALFRNLVDQRGDALSLTSALPEYCYRPGSMWGDVPPLKSGYIPVMLTPPGQYF